MPIYGSPKSILITKLVHTVAHQGTHGPHSSPHFQVGQDINVHVHNGHRVAALAPASVRAFRLPAEVLDKPVGHAEDVQMQRVHRLRQLRLPRAGPMAHGHAVHRGFLHEAHGAVPSVEYSLLRLACAPIPLISPRGALVTSCLSSSHVTLH